MARLSKDTRERMAKKLAKHKVQAEGERLITESIALFEACVRAVHPAPAPLPDLMTKLHNAAKGCFVTINQVKMNVGGVEVTVGEQLVGRYNMGFKASCPHLPRLNGRDWSAPSDSELGQRLFKFKQDEEAFTASFDEAYRKALGALSAFSTGAKLVAEWPESLSVIGDLIPSDDRALPVVQAKNLNAEFGLPA